MRVYIAARWKRMQEMKGHAETLRQDGHTVTARWVDGQEAGLTRECNAIMDYGDVAAADALVTFTEPYGSANVGGGRHVEFGMAYALGKPCVLIGPREVIFHHLPGVWQFDDFESARAFLKGKKYAMAA